MTRSFSDSNLSQDLLRAIERKGYDCLTQIQSSVLDVETTGADLRITSITGSGKTLAIGFALRDIAEATGAERESRVGPRALVIVPTRELAKQVQTELAWLFEERKWRIEAVTGGTSIRDERRALRNLPMVLVATPGRLLDHLTNGAIDLSQVTAVVLDEADRMLDMGFQDDLQAILDALPAERQTHMASATFCDAVGRLANRYQHNPIHVQGTPLGKANEDIDHVVHVVSSGQKIDAVVNLLLAASEEQAIVFARTRVDVATIARELSRAGFSAVSLSGEMAQPARDRALATFRRGETRVLVATDVAARGLDIQGVTRIIHFDAPTDPDGYTHRSGRTGRAGQKGTSHILVFPQAFGFLRMVLRRAGINHRQQPVPTRATLLAQRDERLLSELLRAPVDGENAPDARHRALAERLCSESDAVGLVARLLMRVGDGGVAPRDVAPISTDDRAGGFARRRGMVGEPQRGRKSGQQPRQDDNRSAMGKPGRGRPSSGDAGKHVPEPGYGAFHVTWGESQGADARRLLAIVCRKGRIHSKDVGAIRIGATSSVIEVRAQVAASFAKAARVRDSRDPLVKIEPLRV